MSEERWIGGPRDPEDDGSEPRFGYVDSEALADGVPDGSAPAGPPVPEIQITEGLDGGFNSVQVRDTFLTDDHTFYDQIANRLDDPIIDERAAKIIEDKHDQLNEQGRLIADENSRPGGREAPES